KGLPCHGKNRIFPHPPSSPSGKGLFSALIQIANPNAAQRFFCDARELWFRHAEENAASGE
ncbi:hypothetical protein ACCT30_25335, partial [Rhizobium ruizarguesonis]